ncbi:MAG: hypothetical protein Crog4KO_14210 [Crocinitomicaceae bacterium]
MKQSLTFIALLFFSTLSWSQIDFKTGDAALNIELNDINSEAKKDLESFKKKLLVEHQISGEKAEKLLNIMEPAEVLLSGRLKDLLDISIDVVVQSYEKNKSKGWGAIAKDLGIKPGSPQFHALKGKSKKSKGNSGKSKGKGKSKS